MTAKVRRTSEELIADLSDLDNRFSSLVATCSREQLTSHPNPSGGWSIAECIQHVALTNSQYLAMIRMALGQNEKRAGAANATLSTAGCFSSYFVAKVVAPQSAKRFKAPKAIRPTSVDAQEALQGLLHSHEEIRQILTSNAKSDLNRIRFKTVPCDSVHSRNWVDHGCAWAAAPVAGRTSATGTRLRGPAGVNAASKQESLGNLFDSTWVVGVKRVELRSLVECAGGF